MDISWYGRSCFRLRVRGVSVLTDPYGSESEWPPLHTSAHIITISHEHSHHCQTKGVRGGPQTICGPGEYEIKGVFIIGIRTYHDPQNGAKYGKNTSYLLEFDGLRVCHLGDIGHVPTQEQAEMLSDVDVLLIPVGGNTTLSASLASEVVGMLEPKIVVPMHYRVGEIDRDLDSVDKFIHAMGTKKIEPVPMLTVQTSKLPTDTQIVVLEPTQ